MLGLRLAKQQKFAHQEASQRNFRISVPAFYAASLCFLNTPLCDVRSFKYKSIVDMPSAYLSKK